MLRECIKEAKTVAEALDEALTELGVSENEIEYEVLQEPETKLFGQDIDAKVRVWLEEGEASIEAGEEETDAGFEDDQPFSSEGEPLSEEELDRIADLAIDTLRSLLMYFGAEDAAIDEYEGDEGEILLDIVGEDLAVLIGRHGKTLEALQFLVSSIVNRKLGYRYPIVIDIEGYKFRRRQKVESFAHSAAVRAIKQNTSVRLRPMTPYERRLVHIALRDDKRVTTYSEGEEPNRLVVIKPVRQ